MITNPQAIPQLMIVLTVKATVFLSAGFLCLHLLRRASASSRHLICGCLFGGLVLLPLLTAIMPAWGIGNGLLLWTQSVSHGGAGSRVSNDALLSGSWQEIVVYVWLAGATLCLARFVVGWLMLKAETRGSTQLDDGNVTLPTGVKVRIGSVTSPISFGIVHPVVLLPESARHWNADYRRTVLLHELAHVRRHDCAWNYLSQAALALFWFHPLAWSLRGMLRRLEELACDDAVLRSGVAPAAYADVLLEAARALPSRFLLASSISGNARSHLRTRLEHLLNEGVSHSTASRAAKRFAGTLLPFLLILSSINPLHAEKVYKIGGDVSAPILVNKVEPDYTPEAKAARIMGTVLLALVIDTDGKARQIRVVRSLDQGLDANAVKAVQKWSFRPARRAGKPVSVQAQIEVNFRLL